MFGTRIESLHKGLRFKDKRKIKELKMKIVDRLMNNKIFSLMGISLLLVTALYPWGYGLVGFLLILFPILFKSFKNITKYNSSCIIEYLSSKRLFYLVIGWMVLGSLVNEYSLESLGSAMGILIIWLLSFQFIKWITHHFDIFLDYCLPILMTSGLAASLNVVAGKLIFHQRRATILDFNPNFSATLILIVTAMTISYLAFKFGKDNFYQFPFILLQTLAIFWTGSRGGFLGLGVVLFFHSFNKKNLRRILIISIVMMLVFLMVTGSFSKISLTRTGSDRGRVNMWISAKNMMLDHPLFGVGFSNFSKHYPEYKIAKGPNFDFAHNIFLQLGADMGLVGLMLCLTWFFDIVRRGVKLLSRVNEKEKEIFIGCLIVFIAVLVRDLVDVDIIYSGSLDSLFWILVLLPSEYYSYLITQKAQA